MVVVQLNQLPDQLQVHPGERSRITESSLKIYKDMQTGGDGGGGDRDLSWKVLVSIIVGLFVRCGPCIPLSSCKKSKSVENQDPRHQ